MVFLTKNKVTTVGDAPRLSLPPAGRVAKRCTQSPWDASVPRAKSSPHINLVAEGRSLKPSSKHRVETASRPGGSISVEPASPTTAPIADSCSDQWEEDEGHSHRLLAVAQSWLDFDRLFSQRGADCDQTVEEARRDFCHDLIQSFSGCCPASSSSQVDKRSSDLADSVSQPSVSPPQPSPQPSSATPLTGQTTVTSTTPAKPARSPECPDESQRESDSFSFHFSQDEEWTPEVEARMQAAIDRMLEDARRQLAVPYPNFSVLFPDDPLADSVAHQTAANPRSSRSCASSLEDYDGSYPVDPEDETEEDDGLVSLSPEPSSPACSATLVVDATTIPVSMVEDIGCDIDNVWGGLATYVPRLLTPISEESLADEFVVEEDAKVPCAATAGKTLGQARGFVDLKDPVTLPTLQSISLIETLCETISVHEEDRDIPGCIDLKGFGGSDVYIETSPGLSMVSECSLSTLCGCFSFEERQCLPLDEGPIVQITTKSFAEPPIASKPPDVYLRQRRRRWKPPDLRWKRRWVSKSKNIKKFGKYKINQRRPWSQTLKYLESKSAILFLATFVLGKATILV